MKTYIWLTISVMILFINCNRKRIIEKYPNGSVKVECDMYNGKKNGKCIGYYKNGNIEYISYYKNDLLEGISKFYHPNSKEHWQATFENGVKSGVIDYYDSLGNKYQTSTFKDSRLNGVSKAFYENGKVKSFMNYKNDTLNGDLRAFYKSGAVKSVSTYLKGELIDHIEYDSLGNIINHLLKYKVWYHRENSSTELVVKFLNPIADVVGMKLYKYTIGTSDYEINDPLAVEDSVIRKKLNIKIKRQDSVKIYGVFFEISKIKSSEEYDSGVVRSKQEFIYSFDDTL